MKKFITVLLAIFMVLSTSLTAFADGNNETFTLTITGAAGHTYAIYQIFTGDIATEGDKTVLSNVKYGKNYGETGKDVPAQVLEDFSASQDLADILGVALHNNPIEATPAGNATFVEVSDLEAGYYMIVDITNEEQIPDGQTKSPVMLQIVESITIASKHASISSEKKVDDKNDSTTDENDVNWQDSADYDIGDDVPFRLSVTLPTTLNSYNNYELTFHDKQADGFDAPIIKNVYILKADGTTKIDIPEATDGVHGYTLINSCTKTNTCEFGGCSFNVHVGDIKSLYGENVYAEGDRIIVEYTSKLNDDANIGREGNENGMYVCHPDGHTPVDYVTVLTYALKVNKIDGTSKEALAGAGFTLYKWYAEAKNGVGDWIAVGDEIKGDNITSFVWSGIDGGKYKLVETKTPAGYNTIADSIFVIDANHKIEWIPDGNTAFLDLIAKDTTGTVVVFADRNADGAEDGKLEGNVENYKGTVLPETGAAGTFALMLGGSMLVIVAAVFMITRKKMSVYED